MRTTDSAPPSCPQEGVLALWTGVGPTVGRATALAAAELATYDEVKTQLLKSGYFSPGLLLTVTTAFASGYVSTVASYAQCIPAHAAPAAAHGRTTRAVLLRRPVPGPA